MNKEDLSNVQAVPWYNKNLKLITLLLMVTLFGAIVSWLGFANSGANFQELYNLTIIKHASASYLTLSTNDDPMPAYLILLSLINQHVPLSLFRVRIISIIIYIFLIGMTFMIGLKSTDRLTGFFSAILVALSPFIIWYSSRGSVYILLALIVVTNQYFFIRILSGKKISWLLYFITGLLGLLLHFIFALIIFAQLLFTFIYKNEISRHKFVGLLSIIFVYILAIIGWFYFVPINYHAWQQLPYTALPSSTNIFILFIQYLFGFQSVVTTTFLIAFWPLLVVVALLAVQKYISPPLGIQYLFFSAMVPIGFMFVVSYVFKPLFLSSYLIISAPAFLICIAWYLNAFKLRLLDLSKYVLIAIMLIMLTLELNSPQRALREDYLGKTIYTSLSVTSYFSKDKLNNFKFYIP